MGWAQACCLPSARGRRVRAHAGPHEGAAKSVLLAVLIRYVWRELGHNLLNTQWPGLATNGSGQPCPRARLPGRRPAGPAIAKQPPACQTAHPLTPCSPSPPHPWPAHLVGVQPGQQLAEALGGGGGQVGQHAALGGAHRCTQALRGGWRGQGARGCGRARGRVGVGVGMGMSVSVSTS